MKSASGITSGSPAGGSTTAVKARQWSNSKKLTFHVNLENEIDRAFLPLPPENTQPAPVWVNLFMRDDEVCILAKVDLSACGDTLSRLASSTSIELSAGEPGVVFANG